MKLISFIRFLFLLFIILLTANCSDQSFKFPNPSTEVYDGSFNFTTVQRTYAEIEYNVDLGTLTLLENRRKNGSRYIHLPVIRVRTNAENPLEPVFCFTGGPGMSNLNQIGMKWYLMQNHDVVMVGYRGADGSSILNCPEVDNAIKGKDRLFSEESIQALQDAWDQCAQRFQKEGVDIDGYTILDVIEDNEFARKAFGYDRINLKGVSYGTRVAYIYGLIHPENINRTVMTAVNPPGRFVWERDVFDDQLRELSELWSKDSSASIRSNNLYADVINGLKNAPNNWLFLPIDKDKVRCVAFALLFKYETAAMVFDAFIAARKGDYSGLALMSLAYDFVIPEMFIWGEMACKAVSADYDSTRDYMADLSPTDKYPFGSPMSELLWCTNWQIDLIPEKYRKLQYSDVETLLISGSIDVSTPTRYAKNDLLPYLKNGHHAILEGRGHMDLEWPNPEDSQRLISSFYKNGIPDESLNKPVPVNFAVSIGFPFIAKISLLVIFIVILILTFSIYYILKKIRKKNKNVVSV